MLMSSELLPVAELSHITKRFGPVLALDDVSFRCWPGEVHALVGENGAGKSTLLNILAGIHRPTSGQVIINGRPIDLPHYSPLAAQAAGIAVVHQEMALIGSMSVAENIFLGREPQQGVLLDWQTMRRQAQALLNRLGTAFSPDTRVEELGIAERQLVEIAKALSYQSRVIVMDEPSAVLAGDELATLFRIIRQLTAEGVAVVYVSHRLDEVFQLCDRFTVLKDGAVTGAGLVAEIDQAGLIRLMVGRSVLDLFPARASAPGPARLRVAGLSIPGLLYDISFEARAGEILGMAGLIGSGRTTLGKAICGAIPAAQGMVEVNGHTGPFDSPQAALAAGLAYLPEDRKLEGLALTKSVRWNASLLVTDKLKNKLGLINPQAERSLVSRMIADLAIRTRPGGEDGCERLSGGNQQKVVLAKWLELQPQVLILDEPTRGIDIGAKEEIYRLLRRLAQAGLAIVVMSSELVEVLGLCDRILVLAEGRVTGELPGSTATEEAIMRLATVSHRAVFG